MFISTASQVRSLVELESDILRSCLDFQGGKYFFRDFFEAVFRRNGIVIVAQVLSAETIFGYDGTYISFDVRIVESQSPEEYPRGSTISLYDDEILPGEMTQLTTHIPQEKIDPKMDDLAWKRMNGTYSPEINGEKVKIVIDDESRTIQIDTDVITGEEAYRWVRKASFEPDKTFEEMHSEYVMLPF